MPAAGFESADPAIKRPQTHALDCVATEIGSVTSLCCDNSGLDSAGLAYIEWKLRNVMYEWGSSVSMMSDYRLDERGSILGRGKGIFFPLASVSRTALGPTQPPVQWVLDFLSLGVNSGRRVTLTTHPHLIPRSRIPLCAYMVVAGQLYFLYVPKANVYVKNHRWCHNLYLN
jgi:hypothetical protein